MVYDGFENFRVRESCSRETFGIKAAETKIPGIKAAETETPETKAAETETPETKAAETKISETKAAETETPGTKAAETEISGNEIVGRKPWEKKQPETKNKQLSKNIETIKR